MDPRIRRTLTATAVLTLGAGVALLLRRRASRAAHGGLGVAVVGEPPSAELQRLVAAARRAGAGPARSRLAARVTLITFVECLPPVERVRLLAAWPADVRRLFMWSRRRTWPRREIRTPAQFAAAVAERGGLPGPGEAERVARSVLPVLHQLAGPEAAGVGTALPGALRAMWTDVSGGPSARGTVGLRPYAAGQPAPMLGAGTKGGRSR